MYVSSWSGGIEGRLIKIQSELAGMTLFNGRIEITGKEVIERNGHWFLDIKDFWVIP